MTPSGKHQYVSQLRQRLNATFARASQINDGQLQSDLAKHLCVLVCGYLERAVVALTVEHVRQRSVPSVQRFVEARLERSQNFKPQKLADLLGQFEPDWRTRLDAFLAKEERRSALDSVYANRHQIAHGESVGVTLTQVKAWDNRIEEIVVFLGSLLVPPSK